MTYEQILPIHANAIVSGETSTVASRFECISWHQGCTNVFNQGIECQVIIVKKGDEGVISPLLIVNAEVEAFLHLRLKSCKDADAKTC